MRSNQQKSRSRSRNNSNRSRNTNPLSRSYESNGPDVRVRGNAAHVAEKYVLLSRDAHQSGDSVAAENYLQHAEHYFRIISAAQAQIQTQQIAQQAQHAQQQQARQVENAPVGNGDAVPTEKAGEVATSPENVSPPNIEEVGSDTDTSTEASPASNAGDESAPRPPKRPRRRTRTPEKPVNEQPASVEAKDEGSNPSDPADAPQPEVGLPSFVTTGSETKAAE